MDLKTSLPFLIDANNLDGYWDVLYTTGVNSVYKIEGIKVNVISCILKGAGCDIITESSITPTDDEGWKVRRLQDWKKIPQIHRSGRFLYIRLKQDGDLEVRYRYNSNVNDYITGVGRKKGTLINILTVLMQNCSCFSSSCY